MRGLLKKFVAEVLGFEGFEVADAHWETRDGVGFCPLGQLPYSRDARLVISVQRRWMGRCADCGRRCRNVHEHQDLRRWEDLQWAGHPVSIAYAPDRLRCRYCKTKRVELLPWADPYQRETRRFQQHMALQAASMPTLHVAVQYGVDWHKVRRAEKRALERWDATREVPPLTMVGIDDKYLGRRNALKNKFITIISNLETGEPIWFGSGRGQAPVLEWLGTLSDEQKRSITLFSMDMSQAYTSAVDTHPDLKHAHIVHDPFHVVKRALEALDELRRDTFFRAGPEMRALGKGKRWLFLRAWERTTAQERQDLKQMFRYNRRLATGYQVVEELRDVLQAPDEFTMAMGLVHVMKRIERRDNVPMRKLHDSLANHFERIAALGRHHPPTGRVEALNNNWETAVRQGRGYRDLDFLMLKLRFITANPIRFEDGVRRFLALGLPTPYAKPKAMAA
jgi:transposase